MVEREMPEYLRGALHVASRPEDDDEHWAVKRSNGKWDLYAASFCSGYPTEPYDTVDELPSIFDGCHVPKEEEDE